MNDIYKALYNTTIITLFGDIFNKEKEDLVKIWATRNMEHNGKQQQEPVGNDESWR